MVLFLNKVFKNNMAVTLYACWCYPNGTNGPLYSQASTYNPGPWSEIGNQIGGVPAHDYMPEANALAAAHANDCTIPGAGLWAGYGLGSPTTYWVYKSNPL